MKSLTVQLENLEDWVGAHLAAKMRKPPLKNEGETLAQPVGHDLEPDPSGEDVKCDGR